MLTVGSPPLHGMVAVVTGGAGLLGSRFTEALESAGAKTVSLDIRTPPTSSAGLALACDITQAKQLDEAFNVIERAVGAPSILVNNAGVDIRPDAPQEDSGSFEEYGERAWDGILDSHLKGAFLASREFFRRYRAAGLKAGTVINISSIYGVVAPDQGMYSHRRKDGSRFFKPVAYTVAKAGMIGFTKWLAEYGAPLGIRANAIVPGGVLAGQDEEFVREYAKRTMLGRMGTPNDCIGVLLLLASPAAAYITGTTIVVDGGLTAR